eukprot:jgi/Botrbrau1/2602/Bobra.145_1s0027.1
MPEAKRELWILSKPKGHIPNQDADYGTTSRSPEKLAVVSVTTPPKTTKTIQNTNKLKKENTCHSADNVTV